MDPTLLSICSYVLWFFAYSFVGWIWEVVLSAFQHHRFVNRGFLYGPMLPIYGFGALIAIIVVSPIENLVLAFFVGAALSVLLEYATSWALEKLFHARWWDYSDYFCNLNGRVCLLGALTFGVMVLVVAKLVNPLVEGVTLAIPEIVRLVLAAVLLVAFVVDLVVSVVHLAGFNRALGMVQAKASELAESAQAALAQSADGLAARASDGVSMARDKVSAAREAVSSSTQELRERASVFTEDARAKTDELAESMRAKTDELAESMRAKTDELAEGARTKTGELVEGARAKAGALVEGARDGWAALRSGEGMAELRAYLNDYTPRLRRLAGSLTRDPEFRPTTATEAWDLVKTMIKERK